MRMDCISRFSIINSLMIVLFLSGMVAMILLRTLHRDIAKYNEVRQTDPTPTHSTRADFFRWVQMALAEEAQEETGWKLVHGDVFRKPPHSQILACSAGSGIQVHNRERDRGTERKRGNTCARVRHAYL